MNEWQARWLSDPKFRERVAADVVAIGKVDRKQAEEARRQGWIDELSAHPERAAVYRLLPGDLDGAS